MEMSRLLLNERPLPLSALTDSPRAPPNFVAPPPPADPPPDDVPIHLKPYHEDKAVETSLIDVFGLDAGDRVDGDTEEETIEANFEALSTESIKDALKEAPATEIVDEECDFKIRETAVSLVDSVLTDAVHYVKLMLIEEASKHSIEPVKDCSIASWNESLHPRLEEPLEATKEVDCESSLASTQQLATREVDEAIREVYSGTPVIEPRQPKLEESLNVTAEVELPVTEFSNESPIDSIQIELEKSQMDVGVVEEPIEVRSQSVDEPIQLDLMEKVEEPIKEVCNESREGTEQPIRTFSSDSSMISNTLIEINDQNERVSSPESNRNIEVDIYGSDDSDELAYRMVAENIVDEVLVNAISELERVRREEQVAPETACSIRTFVVQDVESKMKFELHTRDEGKPESCDKMAKENTDGNDITAVKNPPVMHDHRQRTAHLSQSKRAEKEEEVRFESVSALHSLEMAVDSQEESDNPTLAPPPEFEDSSGPPSLPSTNVKETSEPPSPRLSLNREVSNSPSLDVFVDNPSPPPFLDQPTAYDAEIRASPSPPPSVDMEQNSIASSVDLSGPRGDVFVSKEQAELETNGIAHSPSSESVDEYIVKKDTRNLCSQLAFEPQAESEEDGQMEVKFVPSPICLDLKPKMAGEPVVRVPSGREKRRLVRSMAEIRLANPNQANADVWADSDAASESAVINRRHLSASDGGIVTMNASTATLVDSEPQTNSDLPSEHSERTHSTFFSAHRPTSPPWTDASGGHSVSNSEYTDPTIIELEQQLHQWRNQLEQNRRQLERSSSAREPLVNGQSLMQQQIQLQQALMEQMERNILTLKSKRAVSEPPMALANGNGHSTHTSTSSFDQPPNQSSAAHVAPRIVRQCDQHRDAAKPIFDSRLHYRPASVGDGNIPKHDPTPASPPGTSARAARMASREEWRTDTLRSDEV